MAGTLIAQAVPGDLACTLKLYRTNEAEAQAFDLDTDELSALIETLITARGHMSPPIASDWRPTTPTRPVDGLALAVPRQQSHEAGSIVFVVRHPGHGWLSGTISPDQAAELHAGFLAHAGMIWQRNRKPADGA